jgi:IclR family transcriptional regulator, acetate operon repressor
MFHIMKQQAYPGTQAVQRAVKLLKACGEGGPGRRLSDLARAVDLNKTTAFRLLSALESAGLVERTADGDAYQIGAELTRLAGQALGSRALLAAGRPALQALAAATNETITLEVLIDAEVLIVDEVVGSHVIAAMPSLGTRWPAHATSTGKVLLAGLSDLELQRRTQPPLASFTPRTVVNAIALRRELLRARERGYATSVEELEPGFVAVGAPVRAAGGTVIAAISVGGPRSRFSPAVVARIARELPAAADSISERLGWRRPDEAAITRRR